MKIDFQLQPQATKWEDLQPYCADYNQETVHKAFDFAARCHLNQRRISGEAFISHPIWIAKVVAQLGLGEEAVITALLHDTVEDGEAKMEDIATIFGDEVALLVEGLTEISRKTKGIEIHKENIEVFRNFLFSSVNDVRVLIIRLIDKLHNGLTIDSLPRDSQIKYAQRVLSIYGPVAEYVGLHFFKKSLEDIAFKILYPKEASELEKELKKRSRDELLAENSVLTELETMLEVNHINSFQIQSRIKSIYSTYLKIKHGYLGERSFKDRVGLRVLVKNIEDCYTVLGLLHAKYKYIPGEFEDYISNPKANGYRSIQTTLQWKGKLLVEVQIRTFEMHEFNEFGPASHIAYKMSRGLNVGHGMEWVKDLVRWQSDKNVSNYRISVLSEHIYVFTPKGDVIQLPRESTPIDFAYTVHTHLGDYCKGALVNEKMVKIDSRLKTGDLVEILVGTKLMAKTEWLSFVVSEAARTHLRRLRNRNFQSENKA
ncbi:HD domain-containing protein [Patescibacteria group bacterium]|nr:HD domain-containing protein [Patescibacteria group bacterium]